MSQAISRTSISFFVVTVLSALLSVYSFFPTSVPIVESGGRIVGHLVPLIPPLAIAIALRYQQVWAWYAGMLYAIALFMLGAYLSVLLFFEGVYIPLYFVISLVALPSIILMCRDGFAVLHDLQNGSQAA